MRAIRAAAALLVPLAVTACGEQGAEQEAEPPAEAADREMAAEAAGGDADATEITLSPKNDSGITGTARMTSQDGSLTVEVSLSGLAEGQGYATHIHEGTCESGGGVAVGLSPVTGQADGTGSSTATVALEDLEPGQSHHVQAHLPDGTPAACGDVPETP